MKQEDSKERFSTTIHIKLDTVHLAFIPVLFIICSILLMQDKLIIYMLAGGGHYVLYL